MSPFPRGVTQHARGTRSGSREGFDQSVLRRDCDPGLDTVAYFTDAKAVKGSDEFSYTWLDATWHFASAKHRDLFAADPVKYAPQYGGYCSSSMVDGSAYDADPEAWRIIEGKLYLNSSKEWPTKWQSDAAEEIERADSQWGVVKAHLTD